MTDTVNTWGDFWTILAQIKRKNATGYDYAVLGHDTGAGVMTVTWLKSGSGAVLFLPGHAIINGKLVSKASLELAKDTNGDPIPDVTMQDRVDALNAELKRERESKKILLDDRIADLEKQLTKANKDIEEHKRAFEDRVAAAYSMQQENNRLQEENIALKAELARNSVSIVQDGTSGALALADDPDGSLSLVTRYVEGDCDTVKSKSTSVFKRLFRGTRTIGIGPK